MAPHLVRGPQPNLTDLEMLRERGLGGVVNLRDESEQSRAYCLELGLEYHYIPVPDWTAPRIEQVEEFLRLMAETPRTPLLVHCLGGIGRTGVMVSCWRIQRGIPARQAVDLSHREVPWMSMNHEQLRFLLEWERRTQ
ncbi:MAG: dual specificity protein phosphatase family protein [Candidatus Eremiobacterota bacterium]